MASVPEPTTTLELFVSVHVAAVPTIAELVEELHHETARVQAKAHGC